VVDERCREVVRGAVAEMVEHVQLHFKRVLCFPPAVT
jgi:hypothetical protein